MTVYIFLLLTCMYAYALACIYMYVYSHVCIYKYSLVSTDIITLTVQMPVLRLSPTLPQALQSVHSSQLVNNIRLLSLSATSSNGRGIFPCFALCENYINTIWDQYFINDYFGIVR